MLCCAVASSVCQAPACGSVSVHSAVWYRRRGVKAEAEGSAAEWAATGEPAAAAEYVAVKVGLDEEAEVEVRVVAVKVGMEA